MEIHGHDIPKWLGAIIGTIAVIAGFFRAIFVVHESIRSHEKRLKLLEGACDVVKDSLNGAMSDMEHRKLCEDNNHFMCKKVEEVKQSVTSGHGQLALRMDKMDKLRESSKAEQMKRDISIAKTLGRVEEHLKRA